ncbi:hypothetical protein ACFL17_00650 [Pseudomonadota bacterium]
MNRKTSIFLFGSLLLTCTSVFAATIIHIDVTDLSNPNSQADKRIGYIQDGKMSIRSKIAGKDTDLLFSEASSAITVINHRDRTFMLLDEKTVEEFMSGTMQTINRVQEQLSPLLEGLSPEQRAQIESILGGAVQPPKKTQDIPGKYIKTNSTLKVSGIPCQITRLVKAGKPVSELCIAKSKAIKIPSSHLKTLLSMKQTAIKLASAASPLLERLGAQMPDFGEKSPDGLPLMVTDLSENSRMRMTVKSITQGKAPEGSMSVPKGYRPAQLPSFKL